MGCDIHAFVEFKLFPEVGIESVCEDPAHEWMLFCHPHLGRRYVYFAALAGVRSDSESWRPLCPVRGLPVSEYDDSIGRYESMRGAGFHSHSYLSYAEILAALAHAGIDVVSMLVEWRALLGAMEVLAASFETRLVFCFDS